MRPVIALGLLLACPPVLADESDPTPPEPRLRYVVGAGLRWQPEYAGAGKSEARLKPLWAVQYGRWRLSTSGGTSLLGFGGDVQGAGASTELVETARLRVGLALRIDSGRSSGDASTTAGLPDVRRTLRGRLSASYALKPDWQLSAALSQDLLGRHGGLVASADLGWRLREGARSEWTAGAGISAADGSNQRSYFGVTPAGSAATGLRVFEPGAGLRDVHAGIGWTYGLSPRWMAFSSAGVVYLLGPAADSPLAQRRLGGQFGVGLAYRN